MRPLCGGPADAHPPAMRSPSRRFRGHWRELASLAAKNVALHTHDQSRWRHEHVFDTSKAAAERGTRLLLWITVVAMGPEIAAGWLFNSMVLLADGFHMSSHALAIGLSSFAYAAARRHTRDPRFAFGTWKIEILGGFASAVLLLAVAALRAVGSVERLFDPAPIQYREAMLVAVLGLAVNLVSARIRGAAHAHGDDHGRDHDHGKAHDHGHGQARHHDLNLKSAYVHMLTDAVTSVVAIVALWARALIIDTGKVLLDREMDHPVVDEMREVIATHGAASDTLVTDLHFWRVGRAT